MATQAQKVKLVVFLAVTVLVLGGLLFAITGRSFFSKTHTFYVRTKGSVQGLEEGSAVSVRGVEVGSVKAFHLFPDDYGGVEVEIEIDADVPVPMGSRAELKYQGLTGLKMIDITDGSLAAGTIKPGSTLQFEDSTIDLLAGESIKLMKQTEVLVQNLTDITGPENQLRLSELFDRADDLFDRAGAAADAVRDAGRSTERGAARALLQIGMAAGEARMALSDTRELLSGVGEVVSSVRGLVRSSREPIRSAVSNLRSASESFEELGRELRYQPSRVLFSKPPKERRLP